MIANVNVFAEKKWKKKAFKELLDVLYRDADNTFRLTPCSKTHLNAISMKFEMSNYNMLAV